MRQDKHLSLYDCATRHETRRCWRWTSIDAAAVVHRPRKGRWIGSTGARARAGMQISADGKELLYSARGDLFVIHLDTGKWDQLTKTPVAKWTPRSRRTAGQWLSAAARTFTRWTWPQERNAADPDGSDTLRNGGLDWVYPEELDLNTAFWWSPDSKSIAYLQFDTQRRTALPARGPAARCAPSTNRSATRRPAKTTRPCAWAWWRPRAAPRGGTTSGDTRESYLIARAGWMPGSRALYVLRFNRVQNRDALFSIDVESGAAPPSSRSPTRTGST